MNHKVSFLIVATLLASTFVKAEPATAKIISVADFGAVPNDGKDDRAAFIAAIDKARQTPGATLRIPAGSYDVRSVPGLNTNILIEDNLCESPGRHAFVIASSDSVIIRRNRIVGCFQGIYVSSSTNVQTNDNFIAK